MRATHHLQICGVQQWRHPVIIAVQHRNRSIGLLGGSFNPAHAGHVHLSMEAIKRLNLDAVWWLVSPCNPLKQKSDLADYETRLQFARDSTKPYPKIMVSDFERQQGLYYSIDTVAALQQRHPYTRFVWLMGADNLAIFHRWVAWDSLFKRLPIAIFDRAPFSHTALRAPAAKRFAANRLDERDARLLPLLAAPAWSYCYMRRYPVSSTQLRKTLGTKAFLVHNEEVESK